MENLKYLVVADIHGSMIALDEAIRLFFENRADKLVILGDTFGSNAAEMVEKLNAISSRLVIVKGNNDWYYEPQGAKFDLFEQTYLNVSGKIAYVCHGHRLDDMNQEKYGAKIIMQGHVHRPFIEKNKGITRFCPGSIASPRFGSEKAYAIVEANHVTIYSLAGDVLDEADFD